MDPIVIVVILQRVPAPVDNFFYHRQLSDSRKDRFSRKMPQKPFWFRRQSAPGRHVAGSALGYFLNFMPHENLIP